MAGRSESPPPAADSSASSPAGAWLLRPADRRDAVGDGDPGVVSRTVRDSAALYDAIVGHHPGSAYRVALPDKPFSELVKRRPERLKIGYSARSAINPRPSAEAVAAVEKTAVLLGELGHQVDEVAPPYDDAALGRDFLTIWFAQLHHQVADIKRRTGARDSDFEADTLAVSELGRSGGVLAVMSALENRNNYIQSLAEFHGAYDYFLTPLWRPCPGGGCHRDVGGVAARGPSDQQATRGKTHGAQRNSRRPHPGEPGLGALHAAGQPHRAPGDQRPTALDAERPSARCSVRGKLGADGELLQLAAQLEEANPWAHRYPAPGTN